MTRYVFLLLTLALVQPAFAEIYKWTDERGTVNFTEDLGKVPPKYRKKVTVIRGAEPGGAEVTETTIDSGAKEKKKEGAEEKAPAGKQEKKKAVYGNKDEDAWKVEFANLKSDIKATEGEIGERKAKLADTSRMSRSEYLGLQTEVKRLDERLRSLQGKLNALNEAASKAGVPPELR